ncbi:MAG TPA: PrsW family glutamic-type intramembrane protease [Bacteroidota bacterium]|nr:PrsW family glutamic-type intramembrane protease [Bacteroidota bacterium]
MALLALKLLLGLLPVLLFLAALVFVDSYKLIAAPKVLLTIGVGCIAAALAAAANTALLQMLRIDLPAYSRYAAPVLEEGLKGAYLVYLLKTNRVGFMVDGAIRGFAIGAGFALVENMYYLFQLPLANLYLWGIRGFGTAMMHGGTTAIFGIIASQLTERRPGHGTLTLLPGLLVAILIHSIFNHFFVSPLISTLVILVAVPLLIAIAFLQSERATRAWLGVGFDSDQSLLEMIKSGHLLENRIGQYLQSLQEKFPREAVVDMLCYLQVHLELSIRAKGLLLLREAGFEIPPDEETNAQFVELRYLEKSLGKTGLLALHPFLHARSKDLWQITMLRGN